MVTLEKACLSAENAVRKGDEFKKMFAKENSSTRESHSYKRKLSFEQKLQNKMKDSQNSKLNDKSIKDENSKVEASSKENDLTLEKDDDKLLKEKAKDLEKSKELLDIVNAIYQLLMGKKNFDITQKLKNQMNTQEISEVDKKYNNTLYSLLNAIAKLDDNGNEELQKLKSLLQDANLNWKSADGKEGLLQKLLSENELNLAELSKTMENQKNEKMAMDKLEAEDLIRLLIRKLQEGTEEDDTFKKKPTDEIVNYKPLNIMTKSKDVDTNLIKEKTTSKEENFLRSLIGESEEEKGLNKVDEKVNKISHMNGLNNLFKVDRNTPVEIKESLPVNKATILDDVVKNVKYMELNNLKNLTVKVNPKELGEIVIKLTMEAGKFKLALNATSKETYNLLNSNLGEISEKLNTANIKIQPAEINVYNDDTTFFSGQFMGENSKESEKHRNYSSKISKDNVIGSDDEENISINENHNGNLNAKV